MMRCRWASSQPVQHLQTFLFAALLNGLAHDDLRSWLVAPVVEREPRSFARLFDGPAGEPLGHFCYVFLRVSAIDAESVQLHQFAGIVLVQARISVLSCGICLGAHGRDRMRSDTRMIVEIEKHGRAL